MEVLQKFENKKKVFSLRIIFYITLHSLGIECDDQREVTVASNGQIIIDQYV